jgi:hypothetical protein
VTMRLGSVVQLVLIATTSTGRALWILVSSAAPVAVNYLVFVTPLGERWCRDFRRVIECQQNSGRGTTVNR